MMMYMENSSSVKVVGNHFFQLNFTYTKIVTRNDVVHVPGISKNLIFELFYLMGSKWSSHLTSLFCLRKVCLLVKAILWVAYLSLVLKIKLFLLMSVSLLSYDIKEKFMWISNPLITEVGQSLIKTCNKTHNDLCVICSKCKITKKPFKYVKRQCNLLDLFDPDVCEINFCHEMGRDIS